MARKIYHPLVNQTAYQNYIFFRNQRFSSPGVKMAFFLPQSLKASQYIFPHNQPHQFVPCFFFLVFFPLKITFTEHSNFHPVPTWKRCSVGTATVLEPNLREFSRTLSPGLKLLFFLDLVLVPHYGAHLSCQTRRHLDTFCKHFEK